MARRPRQLPRETRLGALSARLADASVVAAELADAEPQKRIRTFSQAAPDDLGAAIDALAAIRDLGLVVHGPRGCAVAAREVEGRIAVTDLDQRDTVLGSGDALLKALKRLDCAVHPAALVVLGAPVVAINNDEIRAVVAEAAHELGKPVVWARTDGFRSAVSATGQDAAAEALLNLIEQDREREPDLVNLICPWRSPAVSSLAAAVESLGLQVNLLPAGAGLADVRRAARAAASLVLDPDGFDTLAAGLEQRFGVGRPDAPLPVGPRATFASLARLAEITGARPPQARPAPPGEALRGRRLALAAPPAFAFALADLAAAADAEVVALTVPHLDRTHAPALAALAKARPEAVVHVGDGQDFELANLWKRLAPDLVLGGVVAVAAALRVGVAAARLDPADVLGANADAALDRAAADALAGRALATRLSRRARYTPGWLRRSPDWHIKLEVK